MIELLNSFHYPVISPPQIRRPLWRRLLEQCQVLDDATSLPHDDLLGHCLRRLVPAAHVPAGGRVGDRICQPREERDREAGRSGGPDLGRSVEATEGEEGVEGAAAGGVY